MSSNSETNEQIAHLTARIEEISSQLSALAIPRKGSAPAGNFDPSDLAKAIGSAIAQANVATANAIGETLDKSLKAIQARDASALDNLIRFRELLDQLQGDPDDDSVGDYDPAAADPGIADTIRAGVDAFRELKDSGLLDGMMPRRRSAGPAVFPPGSAVPGPPRQGGGPTPSPEPRHRAGVGGPPPHHPSPADAGNPENDD